MIIGSGSISFEVIRHLTEILPIVLRPGWLRTRCQPIAIRDVLAILIAAVTEGRQGGNHIYDIGGPDILTYQEMMQEYATAAGLRKRLVIPAPVLAGTRLSAYFVGMSTPLPQDHRSSTDREPAQRRRRHAAIAARLRTRETRRIPGGPRSGAGEDLTRRGGDPLVRCRHPPRSATSHRPLWAGAKVQTDRRIVMSPASTEDVFWAVSRIGAMSATTR